jgi:hypothetical protein
MPIIKRSEKGAPLTNAEIDANWDACSDLSYMILANRGLTGGGVITVNAPGSVYWSQRFVIVSSGNGAHFSLSGYFDIHCPTSGTIAGVGGASNKTATAAGIPLEVWETLYYILPIGSSYTSLPGNFRVASWTSALEVPSNWLPICVRNGENGVFYFSNGVKLRVNESLNQVIHDARNADLLDGNQASAFQAALVSGTNIKTINSTSLLGTGDIIIASAGYLDGGGPASTYGGVLPIDGGGV